MTKDGLSISSLMINSETKKNSPLSDSEEIIAIRKRTIFLVRRDLESISS